MTDQARGLLTRVSNCMSGCDLREEIRDFLAKPVEKAEPVAWAAVFTGTESVHYAALTRETVIGWINADPDKYTAAPLYLAPPLLHRRR